MCVVNFIFFLGLVLVMKAHEDSQQTWVVSIRYLSPTQSDRSEETRGDTFKTSPVLHLLCHIL